MTSTSAPAATERSTPTNRWMLPAALGVTVGVIGAAAIFSAAQASTGGRAKLEQALAERLPRTKVSAIDCNKLPGLCEIAAGQTLFYTDPKARYLIIGRVYDMESRTDLTAARLLELNPDTLLAGAPHNEVGAQEGEGGSRVAEATRVPLAELPKAGAIRWGKASGPRLVVFSDLRCSYCRELSETLDKLNVQIEERPISILGSRKLTEAVYCAKDPVNALHAAYAGEEVAAGPRCDTAGLDANEAFARKHGFGGTPIIVRADGEVLRGYRPAPVIAAWIAGKAAA